MDPNNSVPEAGGDESTKWADHDPKAFCFNGVTAARKASVRERSIPPTASDKYQPMHDFIISWRLNSRLPPERGP